MASLVHERHAGTPASGLPIKPPCVHLVTGPADAIYLEQQYSVPPPPRSIPHLFAERAQAYPDRKFVAKRARLGQREWGDWRTISYAAAWRDARAVAQSLIDLRAGPDAPVMVLSEPSIEHAVIGLAAQIARAPLVSISPAYSLIATDFSKLRHAVQVCRPRIIFVEGEAYRQALAAVPLDDVVVVSIDDMPGLSIELYGELVSRVPTAAIDASMEMIDAATVARFIFTSGSTGAPKAVVHSQGTLTAMLAAREALLADPLAELGSLRLSWMPWSHSGGVIHLNFTVADAGTFYIDEGRPIAGQFGETLRNLREVVPAEFGTAPIMYGQLVAALEQDPVLRDHFFTNVRYASYASAALSDDVLARFQELAVRVHAMDHAACERIRRGNAVRQQIQFSRLRGP